jgi:hypothetical protein
MHVGNSGSVVTLGLRREADVQQAEHFDALLVERRGELCDLLEQQAMEMAACERLGDLTSIRQRKRLINEIGAEIRDIDRMRHALMVGLLGGRLVERSV